MKIIEAGRSVYHEGVVRKVREGHATTRLIELNVKNRRARQARWLGLFNTPLTGNSLTLSESLERASLQAIHWAREALGDEPLGNYDKLHFGREGDGSRENPFTLAFDATVDDALPGLFAIAASLPEDSEGVYFTDRSTYEDRCNLYQIDGYLEISAVPGHPSFTFEHIQATAGRVLENLQA